MTRRKSNQPETAADVLAILRPKIEQGFDLATMDGNRSRINQLHERINAAARWITEADGRIHVLPFNIGDVVDVIPHAGGMRGRVIGFSMGIGATESGPPVVKVLIMFRDPDGCRASRYIHPDYMNKVESP